MSDEYQSADAFGLLRSYSRHRDFVRLALTRVIHELEARAIEHDASKMLDDEFGGFARINKAARVHKFGSPEYSAGMDQERPTIDLHFSRNSHHPEFHSQTFLDVIEMVCDWWGARKGYDSKLGWAESVELNLKQKARHLSPERVWLAREVASFLHSRPITARCPTCGFDDLWASPGACADAFHTRSGLHSPGPSGVAPDETTTTEDAGRATGGNTE